MSISKDLINIFTHNISQRLQIISGAVNNLLATNTDEKIIKNLNTINNQNTRIIDLVNQLRTDNLS